MLDVVIGIFPTLSSRSNKDRSCELLQREEHRTIFVERESDYWNLCCRSVSYQSFDHWKSSPTAEINEVSKNPPTARLYTNDGMQYAQYVGIMYSKRCTQELTPWSEARNKRASEGSS